MGKKIRKLMGSLKDKAALLCTSTTAAATTPTSPRLVVLRLTTHHNTPPHPHHLLALLAFGHASRLSAAAAADALVSRLSASHSAAVALKSLLSIRHVSSSALFILKDQLAATLLPAAGRRNPLNLSGFRDPDSLPLSALVRWYARVLELLLAAARATGSFPNLDDNDEEKLSSLLNADLLAELESLISFVEEACRAPAAAEEGNELVREVVRVVEEDRLTAEREIVGRVKEMGERLGSIGFAESVELVCLIRRFEDCRARPSDDIPTDGDDVLDVMKRVGEVVVKEERRMRRDRGSESARFVDGGRVGPGGSVRFESTRWADLGPLSC